MDIHFFNQPTLAIQNLAVADPTFSWLELGIGIVVIAIAIASLSFWYMAITRLINKQELIPYRRSESVLGFIDLVAVFACWLGSQVASGVVLVVVAGPDAVNGSDEEMFAEHGVLLLYLSAVFGILSLIVGGAYLILRYRTTNSFGLRLGQVRQQVGYGVVVFTMLFPITLLIQYLLSLLVEYDHPVLSVLTENPSFVPIFGCWAAAVLQAPFVEEFLFRGVFQHWMERLSVSKLTDDRMLIGGSSLTTTGAPADNTFDDSPGLPTAELMEPSGASQVSTDADLKNPYLSPHTHTNSLEHQTNPYISPSIQSIVPQDDVHTVQPKFAYWPILVSSACFALIHWGQGLAPIPLFVLALGLGYLFRQTGSLIACITVHFLLNFYSMFVFTVMILLGETP